jgi:hypothetical protein
VVAVSSLLCSGNLRQLYLIHMPGLQDSLAIVHFFCLLENAGLGKDMTGSGVRGGPFSIMFL